MKKGIYKRILAMLTTMALLPSTSCSNNNPKFQTYKGERNLEDYKDFLEQNDIDYKECYAEANENIITIYEKTYGTHTVTETNANTIDEIINLYGMEKIEFLNLNYMQERELKLGEELKIYFYKPYTFTLEELDESSKWIYHYVMPGETLSEIAQYYDITLEELAQENRIGNISKIEAYTTLKIPKKQKEKTIN